MSIEGYNNPVAKTGTEIEREGGMAEFAATLNAFLNDPSKLADFATHLIDAMKVKLGWTDADINPTTFESMDDDQLLSHLSEFLGSGQINVSINGGVVELPQLMLDISRMSDEELADLDIGDPRVTAAKLRKATAEAAKDAADRAHDREMEERRKEWDAGNMDVMMGGVKLKSGRIDSWLRTWNDPEKKERWVQEYSKIVGLNKKDSEDELAKLVRMGEVVKKKTTGETLTPEEEKIYIESQQLGMAEKINNANKTELIVNGQNTAADIGFDKDNEDINITRQTSSASNQESVSVDTSVAKPVTEKSAAYQDFPSAEGIEIRKNFASAAAANSNMPVVEKDPAPVMVAKAELKVAATADMAF